MSTVLAMKDYDGKTPLKRVSKTVVEDEKGNRYRTHSGTNAPGIGQGKGGGQPKIFKNAEDLLSAWREYLNNLIDNDFQLNGRTVYPGKGKFACFCKCDERTIYNAVEKYFPEIKKDWESMLSECLTDGVAAGAYQTAFTIFMMKNLCEWSDKQETKVEQRKVQVATKKEAAEALKEYAKGQK